MNDRLPLLLAAAVVGALLAHSIRPRAYVVQREKVIGGHDASNEPIIHPAIGVTAPTQAQRVNGTTALASDSPTT